MVCKQFLQAFHLITKLVSSLSCSDLLEPWRFWVKAEHQSPPKLPKTGVLVSHRPTCELCLTYIIVDLVAQPGCWHTVPCYVCWVLYKVVAPLQLPEGSWVTRTVRKAVQASITLIERETGKPNTLNTASRKKVLMEINWCWWIFVGPKAVQLPASLAAALGLGAWYISLPCSLFRSLANFKASFVFFCRLVHLCMDRWRLRLSNPGSIWWPAGDLVNESGCGQPNSSSQELQFMAWKVALWYDGLERLFSFLITLVNTLRNNA